MTLDDSLLASNKLTKHEHIDNTPEEHARHIVGAANDRFAESLNDVLTGRFKKCFSLSNTYGANGLVSGYFFTRK
jgi:hypothetical protein